MGDREERLSEALFALSARMKGSGFLDDQANHAAYEHVVNAFNMPVQQIAESANCLSAAIDEEREAIVKWLRDDAGKTRDDLMRLHANRRLTTSQTEQWEDLISLKIGIVAAIERGEHRNRETRRG